jgi:hypothetical protein
VTFRPVIRHRIREDGSVPVEGRRRDCSADRGVAFETVFGVLVPAKCQLEATWRRLGGFSNQKWKVPSEPAVEKVPKVGWNEMAFTLKTCVEEELPEGFSRWHLNEKFMLCIVAVSHHVTQAIRTDDTYPEFLSSTYCMAHRPSMLPTAKPEASGKQLITLVCHLRGLCIVLKMVVGLARLIILMYLSAVPTTIKPWATSRV